MRYLLFSGILALFMTLLLACGSAEDPTATPEPPPPTASAAPTMAPTEAAMEEEPTETAMEEEPTEVMMEDEESALTAAADAMAGGPGAFYVGDLNQLVGPVPTYIEGDIGNYDGVVIDHLEDYLYVFESDYYQRMVERANFTSPTEVTTTGEELNFQFACINRSLTHCKIAEWFSDRVFERTDGQLKIDIIGYPELGIAGPDVLELLGTGTLSFAELPAAYTAGDLPAMDMKNLWGVYRDNQTFFEATAAAIPELDRLIEERTNGGITILQFWRVPENEIFFFSKEPLAELEDFEGLKVRSFGGALSDLIDGMGSEAQFVAFAEVYTALERGILDGGVTGANAAYGQRWYEVTDYMAGGLPLFTVENGTVNREVWDNLPADFRGVLWEEGARYELEFFRVTPVLSSLGIPKLLDTGMTYIPFSDELKDYMFEEVGLKRVIPNWVSRVGGYDTEAVEIFNKTVGPVAGVRVNPDGSASLIE